MKRALINIVLKNQIVDTMNLDATSNTDSARKSDNGNRVKKAAYFAFGTAFLILGGLGVFLPILPTAPFLLLSAACYYKSSERMHYWLFNNRWFGNYLRNYAEGKGISLRAKLFTMSLLWMLIIYARGSWVAGVTKSGVVVLAGLGASLAMGLSGFFGALLAEKAERERHLNDMEKATNNKVEDIHYEAEVCHGLRGARR
jgi:hypothetical protein